jgi:S-adenosyl methyltransferase
VTNDAEFGTNEGLGGLPIMDNVHEVARRVNPHAAVVYVDNNKVPTGETAHRSLGI